MKRHIVDINYLSKLRHDLKTPLTTLQIYLESIEKKLASKNTEEAEKYILKAKESIKSFVKILDKTKSAGSK